MEDAMSTTEGGLLADFYTEQELAEEVRKDIRTVQRWRKLRIGPPVTFVGKTPFYRKPAARAWLSRRERTPPDRRRGSAQPSPVS
jgi:hypothetical protein